MTEIPEHLIMRARAARMKREPIPSDPLSTDPGVSIETTGFVGSTALRDVAEIIDIQAASSGIEVCNLTAVAIRERSLNLMFGDRRSVDQYDVSAVEVSEDRRSADLRDRKAKEYYDVATNGAISLQSGTENRRFRRLQRESTRFAVWVDAPSKKTKWLSSNIKDFSRQDAEFLPIYYGLTKTSSERNAEIFVPILKGYRTQSNCHVVLPDGEQLDVHDMNRQGVLDTLSEILTTENEYNDPRRMNNGHHGIKVVNEDKVAPIVKRLLRELSPMASTNPTFAEILETSYSLLGEAPVRATQTAEEKDWLKSLTVLKNQVDAIRNKRAVRKVVKLADGTTETIEEMFETRPVDVQTAKGVQKMSYLFARDGVITDAVTGIRSTQWRVLAGYTEDVYGELAIRTPVYSIVLDELNRLRVSVLSSSGNIKRDAHKNELEVLSTFIGKNIGSTSRGYLKKNGF